jgi:LPS-assembly protein
MRSVGRLLVAGLAFLFIGGGVSFAAEETNQVEHLGEPATVDAQQLNFDRPNNMAYGEGDVVIRHKGATLRADRVRYNTETKDAWADGNVRLSRDGQEWVAPAVYYNFETGAMKVDTVRGFTDPVFLRADHVEQVTNNFYRAARLTLTPCDYEEPHLRVQATHAEIYPGDHITMHNATLRIGDVPCLWTPVLVWSLKGDAQPLALSVGQSSRWGFFVLSTTHWRLNDSVNLDFLLDERTRRGVGSGPELKYRLGDEGWGSVRGYYVNDAQPEDNLDRLLGKDIPTNRYRAEWQHKQSLPHDLDLTVDLTKQSDADVIDDFFSHEFRHNGEPGSVIDLTKRGESYTLSTLIQPEFNVFFAEVERLPEVKLAVNRTKIGPTRLFYEGESSAGYYNTIPGHLINDPLFRGSGVRVDSFHQFVLPEVLFGWLSIVPRAGGRYTYYTRAPDTAQETNEIKRVVADLGAEASFKLSRTWRDVQNTRRHIDGLRHIVQPFADYQWVPTPNVRSNELFQFDTVRSLTITNSETIPLGRYLPFDFPAYNEIDAIERQNMVRFGLRQRLQTQRDGQPWDLVELTGWTDWNVEQNGGEKDFANLFGTLELRPVEWLALDSFARYDFEDGILREFNTEARVSDADRWSVGLGTRYLRDDSNLVSASAAWRLSRHWVAQIYERVDMQDGQWEEQDYMLRQETHDWYISYGFRYRSERLRSDEKAVFFSFTLKAFPGVQLSANRVDLGTGN